MPERNQPGFVWRWLGRINEYPAMPCMREVVGAGPDSDRERLHSVTGSGLQKEGRQRGID